MTHAESFFRDMFHHIWQSHDIEKLDQFYAKDFHESIATTDDHLAPVENQMNYEYMVEQAALHKRNFRDTTLDIKKLIANDKKHIAIYFYSSAIEIKTGKKRYRYVSGIWRLNAENKIDRVWATVTAYGINA